MEGRNGYALINRTHPRLLQANCLWRPGHTGLIGRDAMP